MEERHRQAEIALCYSLGGLVLSLFLDILLELGGLSGLSGPSLLNSGYNGSKKLFFTFCYTVNLLSIHCLHVARTTVLDLYHRATSPVK